MKCSKKNQNRIDWCLFSVLLLAMSGVCLVLFYRQTVVYRGDYMSDMEAYVRKMLGTETVYSFPYPIFFRLGAFMHLFVESPELSIALATMLLNAAAVVVTKVFFVQELCRRQEDTFFARILSTAGTYGLFFVSMLYADFFVNFGIHFHYVGVFTPTPWQNATYLAARPFAILALLWWVRVVEIYEKQEGRVSGPVLRDYLLFALFMLLVTMTKPSYTLPHLAAAGCVMLWRLIKSKGKNFPQTLRLALCYVPTLLDLLYQYSGVFTGSGDGSGGVGFRFFYVWSQYTENLPLAILLAAAFPLCTLVLHFKELGKNALLTFSWQVYVAGLAMALLCYEKGFRQFDFNFSWGYMCGLFAVFFASVWILLRDTAKWWRNHFEGQKNTRSKERFSLGKLSVQWVLFAAHLICGLRYFLLIFSGGSYY